jgi:hypothetical protein
MTPIPLANLRVAVGFFSPAAGLVPRRCALISCPCHEARSLQPTNSCNTHTGTPAFRWTGTLKELIVKIELKNVKHAAFASEETDCFEASVYIDGVRSGKASNEGRGGCTNFDPRSLEVMLDEYAKTLPKIDMSEYGLTGESQFMEQSAETLIGNLLNVYLTERHEKRLCAKSVLYRIPGQSYKLGEYNVIKKPFTSAVKLFLFQKYGNSVEILNEKFV